MPAIRRWLPLFLVSFATLFFEVLVIRWAGSEIRALSYFKNVVLLAAVLGMGLGCASLNTGGKGMQVHPRYIFGGTFLILAALIAFAPALDLTHMKFAVSADFYEWTKDISFSANQFRDNSFKLVGIFLLIVACFQALGRLLGTQLEGKTPLPAYCVNLLGSFFGVVVFALLCCLQTTPVVWVAVAFASLFFAYWDTMKSRLAYLGITVAAIALAFVSVGSSLWSPYYRIDLLPYVVHSSRGDVQLGDIVNVNHVYHQRTEDLSDKRSAEVPELKDSPEYLHYNLPYILAGHPKQVLIVGAGTGNDVSAALRAGAEWIDAVEIDPTIQKLGTKIHPEHPYDDPRVHVHINDARAFIQQCNKKYDLIVFGFLDSHTAFSVASSVRLDNYLYTKESMLAAKKLLSPDGLAVISFGAGTDWLRARFYHLGETISGAPPVVLGTKFDANGISVVGGGPALERAKREIDARYKGLVLDSASLRDLPVELPTDDWPFLYQKQRSLPLLYALVLGLLGAISLLMVFIRFRMAPREFINYLEFFLLGAGFLLLETRSMLSSAVLFGSTWIVNSIMIGVVLLMALAGAMLTMKYGLARFRKLAYAAILISLALSFALPLPQFAGLDLPVKLLLALVLLGLPFFFASLVFSQAFAKTGRAEMALGINIMGAVVGACLEYTSLLIGSNGLLILAAALYVAAFISSQLITPQKESPPASAAADGAA